VTPIRSVDRITIGAGKRGEITRKVQEVFFAITAGEQEAPNGAKWLTYVGKSENTVGEIKTAPLPEGFGAEMPNTGAALAADSVN
jgi:hypothetical protein